MTTITQDIHETLARLADAHDCEVVIDLGAGRGTTLAAIAARCPTARADIESGGLDQLLNMQVCRRVMDNSGQTPEVIIATGLIEGTDGSGTKMSKSKGNYVGLAFEPKDVFGKLMSAADRLVPTYLRALTELLDPEVELLQQMMAIRRIHPMGVKTLLAAEVTSTIHGLDAAAACRAGFAAQFSAKRFSDAQGLPGSTAPSMPRTPSRNCSSRSPVPSRASARSAMSPPGVGCVWLSRHRTPISRRSRWARQTRTSPSRP